MNNMKHFPHHNNGFTLVETIIAIFILSMTIGALLTLAANGFYSVRYSRNQIVADNLAQEAIEYIRNTRDTVFLTDYSTVYDPTVNYNKWVALKNSFSGCFTGNGCIVDIYTTGANFIACGSTCPFMRYFENNGIYGYTYGYPFSGGTAYDTSYVRTITMTPASSTADYIIVTVTIRWLNGNTSKTTSQSVLLTNWRAFQP